MFLVLAPACSRGGLDGKWPDQGTAIGADADTGPRDLSRNQTVDLTTGGGTDLSGGGGIDLSTGGPTDLSTGGPTDLANARPPCQGAAGGFAAFRFSYSANGGTSARLDAFGLPDNSNWQATPVFATMIVDQGNGGGLDISGGNYILIRYSVRGLSQITRATVSVFGRSYNTTASGSFETWTPIHGTRQTPVNSFSNAWPYRWSSLDFTGLVQPNDDPGLTGIRLYARGGSDSLVISRVELCLEAS